VLPRQGAGEIHNLAKKTSKSGGKIGGIRKFGLKRSLTWAKIISIHIQFAKKGKILDQGFLKGLQ
jgi:hypothetical protein